MEVLEIVQKIHDDRRTLIEQARNKLAEIEAHTDAVPAETQAAYERMDADITEMGKRIDNLMALAEQNKHADEQRAKYETLIQAPSDAGEKDFEDKLRAWLKAGHPDSETFAPRRFRFSLSPHLDAHHVLPDGRRVWEQHDLTKGTATAGGATVPTGFVPRLYEHLVEMAGVRRTNADVIRTDSGETLNMVKTTTHGSNAAIVAEGGAFGEADPAVLGVPIGAFKYGKLIDVSSELVEDTAVDLLGYLARAAGIAVGLGNGAHLVTGTGTGQPEGIAASPTVGKTGATGQTTTVIGNDLIDLFHSIVSGYRVRAFWVMNDLSVAIVRKIRDDTGGSGLGNYLWQPGLVAGAPDTLLGKPVISDPGMAVMAANAHSIAFGDFSLYYVIRDVNSVEFRRSDDFRFDTDLISFRVRFRTDARQMVNGSGGAVKFYRNSAT